MRSVLKLSQCNIPLKHINKPIKIVKNQKIFERRFLQMQTTINIPPIMTFSECKSILKVGKNTLLGLLHSGQLDGFMIGNRWRITREALIEYINNA